MRFVRVDLVGQRFGRLRVLAPAPRNNRKARWFCVCDCGNFSAVDGNAMAKGKTRSCGCLRKDVSRAYMLGPNRPRGGAPPIKDMTGQRFGRLVAQEAVGRRNTESLWRCLCDCGNEALVRVSVLTRGDAVSCGCYRRELSVARGRDYRGLRFGRLRVLARSPRPRRWFCVCDCGNFTETMAVNLVSGSARSCGCLARELTHTRSQTHGRSHSIEYKAWEAMRSRCYRATSDAWENYGGRGITVCARWRNSFENFLADVGPRPSTQHHLHRWDVDGNYEPSNVSWNVGGAKRTIKGLEAKISELERQLRSDSWQQEERDAIQEDENSPS